MFIPNFIRQIPTHMDNALRQVIIKGAEAKHWLTDYWTTKRDEFSQFTWWQESGKPFYERNIKPLTKIDYLRLTGSVLTAVLLTTVAMRRFGVGAFPLAASGGTLIVMGAYYLSRNTVQKHFDEKAWGHIDQIRRIAHKITDKNQKFGDINQHRTPLMQPEFKHLDDDLKKLDEEISKFKTAVLSPSCEDKKQIIKAHLTYLRTLVQANAQDKNAMDALEEAVDKVGQTDQDLNALELQKQKLHDLQTLAAQTHIVELKQQIDALIKTIGTPILADSKKALIKHLEGLQKKLAQYLEVKDLSIEDEKIEEHDEQSSIDDTPDTENQPIVEEADDLYIGIDEIG